jgi:hypothetical protein
MRVSCPRHWSFSSKQGRSGSALQLQVRAGSASAYTVIGAYFWRLRIPRGLANTLRAGLSRIGQDKTSKRASHFSMKMDLQQPLLVPTDERPIMSYTSKRVSAPPAPSTPLCDRTDCILAEEANRTYSAVLRQEMFESSVPQAIQSLSPTDSANMRNSGRSHTPPVARTTSTLPAPSLTPSTPHKNLFSYQSPRHSISGQPTPSRTPHSRHTMNLNARSEIYSLSPVKYSSQRMLLSPQKTPRAVAKVPYKVLDAPDLADDFYLNLVDWGSQNTLGVGLGSCVYMWNSNSGRVTKLCELQDDTVTSVNWIQRVS